MTVGKYIVIHRRLSLNDPPAGALVLFFLIDKPDEAECPLFSFILFEKRRLWKKLPRGVTGKRIRTKTNLTVKADIIFTDLHN